MKFANVAVMFLVVAGLLGGCSIAGPAYPEKDGRAYLEKRGVSSDLISKLIEGKALSASEVEGLQTSESLDVRFLVARNPNLTQQQIAKSLADKNDFVRSGAAKNTNLSSDQIALLTDDESHTVYASLAGNTALSESELFRLRDKRDLEGLWFAMNPNCPDSIRQEINASDDSLAKQWLETIEEQKRDGFYVQDANGRWHESRTAK